MNPKDKTDKEKICGSVYKINCKNCDHFYLGESNRALHIRLAEHARSNREGDQKSATSDHIVKTKHQMDFDNTQIIDCDIRYYHRKVKEAIWIRTCRPQINRDTGINLPHIYDTILETTNRNTPAPTHTDNLSTRDHY